MRVAVVSVPVSDQARAKRFYVDQLGCELIRDDDGVPGLRWIQVRPQGGSVTLTLVDWFESMPAGSLRGLVFAVDDVYAEHERLSSSGVPFDGPPVEQPWATEAVFHDPDGNEFVLQQGQLVTTSWLRPAASSASTAGPLVSVSLLSDAAGAGVSRPTAHPPAPRSVALLRYPRIHPRHGVDSGRRLSRPASRGAMELVGLWR